MYYRIVQSRASRGNVCDSTTFLFLKNLSNANLGTRLHRESIELLVCVAVTELSAVVRAVHWSQVMSDVSQGRLSDARRSRRQRPLTSQDGHRVRTYCRPSHSRTSLHLPRDAL